MGRAPCCEKMGLKKGPWAPEEDQLLVDYIRLHGHSNWRALPKQAGLLRCGKSCRLRWINYLRPDIKRGNFTQQEEETIIKLHEMLGNRWSAIAAKLPGRTDNEIKNVWHTHLKKRLSKQDEPRSGSTTVPISVRASKKRGRKSRALKNSDEGPFDATRTHVNCVDGPEENNINNNHNYNNKEYDEGDNARPTSSIKREPFSPQTCTSEVSTITTSTSTIENDNLCEENNNNSVWSHQNDNPYKENVGERDRYSAELCDISDEFWLEVLSFEDTTMSIDEDLPSISPCHLSVSSNISMADEMCVSQYKIQKEEMDTFWYNLMTRSDDLPELYELM